MAGLGLTRLAIVALDILLAILYVVANTDFCGSVFETQVGKPNYRSAFLFPSVYINKTFIFSERLDYAMVGQVMSKAVVADEFECYLKCLGNNSCKSFNVHPDGNNAKLLCELNNKTRPMKPGHFKRKKGS